MLIRSFEKHNKISWMITLIGACLIFYISSLTFDYSVGVFSLSYASIAYHVLAFFCFGFFLLISIVRGKNERGLFILGALIAFIYAISDEVHQYFVAGRYCTGFDVLLDSIGIMLVGLIYGCVILYRRS